MIIRALGVCSFVNVNILQIKLTFFSSSFVFVFVLKMQERNARVTINAVHPGIVKTGIIRAHKGFITGMHALACCQSLTFNII